MKRVVFAIFCFVFLTAETYYINPADPIPVFNSGNTYVFKDGIYNGDLNISQSNIIVKAENPRQATLNGRITISGSNTVITGIKIIPRNGQQYGISDRGIYTQILNCHIDGKPNVLGSNNTALSISGQNCLADSNYITGTCFGITLSGTNHTVRNNDLYAMCMNGSCGDVDYIRFFGSGHIIRSNKLHGVDMSNIGAAHVDGFQTFDNNGAQYSIKNIIIEGNFVSSAHQGMMLESSYYNQSDGLTIRNNVFKRCLAWGLCINGIKNVQVSRNTFDMTGGIHGAGCGNGASCGFNNNIFYNGSSSYWFENSTVLPSGNNLLYRAGYTITGFPNDIINKTRECQIICVNELSSFSGHPVAVENSELV